MYVTVVVLAAPFLQLEGFKFAKFLQRLLHNAFQIKELKYKILFRNHDPTSAWVAWDYLDW